MDKTSVTLPDIQKVWAWYEKGDPGNLVSETRAVPVAGVGEVVIRNLAIGLNPVDWKILEWGHADWQPGHVPGVDGCGTIVAIGEGVNLPLGLRVAYHQSLRLDGSFAEFVCIDARALFAVPKAVSEETAAAFPCPGMTAWQAYRKVPGYEGRDVLVTGAGGAVGSILAQLVIQANGRVWLTASERRRGALLSLGAAGVFDYDDPDWRNRLSDQLGPRKLHAAFDTISGAHAQSLLPLLGYNGHIVCIQDKIADTSGLTGAVSVHEVALNAIHRLGVEEDWRGFRSSGEHLLERIAVGGIRLPTIKTYSFDKLPEILAELKNGLASGKLVVVPKRDQRNRCFYLTLTKRIRPLRTRPL